jgi:dolichol-phosphate mannosyltransferase
MRVLVVLPTYQEAENIATVLRRLRDADRTAHVLVVDDASPDGTADLAVAVGEELGRVDVLRRPGKAGLGSAYRDGFAWGLARGFDAFVEMDSDLSHDPAALPDLLAPLSQGVDVVVGSRYVPGGSIPQWGVHRRALSRAGNVYAALMLGLRVTDLTSGYRAYAASILRRIDLGAVRADGYGFQIEMVHRAALAGGLVTEVPIRFVDRVEGRSKMSMRTIVEALALVSWWGTTRVLGRRAASRAPEMEPGLGTPHQHTS